MKILIIDENANDVQFIKNQFFGQDVQIDGAKVFSQAVQKIADNKPDILFVNVNMVTRFLEAGISFEQIYTIALTDMPEPEYLRLCMAIKATDLLVKPLIPQEIKEAYDKAQGLIKKGKGGNNTFGKIGKVISFFTKQKSIGQTLISFNLAVEMAQFLGAKVLWIDLNQGNYETRLVKLQSDELLVNTKELTGWDFYKTAKIDILFRKLENKILNEDIFSIITKMKKNYDFIIVDSEKDLKKASAMVFNISDTIIYLMTLDEEIFAESIKAFKSLCNFNIAKENINILVNHPEEKKAISKKDAEAKLEHKISFFLPQDDNEAKESLAKKIPFVTLYPQSLLSQKIQILAENIKEGTLL